MAFPQTPRHLSKRSETLPLKPVVAELIEMHMVLNTIVETRI
ncbi:hypothetical protein [Limnohabitans sp.]